MKRSIASILVIVLMAVFCILLQHHGIFAAKCAMTMSKTQTTLSPSTGLVLWPGSRPNTNYKGAISLEYSYFAPSAIAISQNSAGVISYNWSTIETFLETCQTNGHAGIIRFYYVYPPSGDESETIETKVPSFIKSSTGYTETSLSYGDSMLKYPDWSNAKLKAFHKQFYQDLATKYDSDPRLAYLQVGFGNWGEYHMFNDYIDTPQNLGVNFPTKIYQVEFLQVMKDSFLNTPFSISIDAAAEDYTSLKATPRDDIPFGLFDDSFMHKEHELVPNKDFGYNEQCWIDLNWFNPATPRWKIAPAGGEVSYYTANDQKNFLDDAGMYGRTFASQSTKYKLTYLLANDAPEAAKNTPAKFVSAALSMGYRFVLQSVAFDKSTKKMTIVVKNTGVAPPYHNHYLKATWATGTSGSSTSTTSLKLLLPTETASIVLSNIDFTKLDTVISGGSTTWLSLTSPKVSSTITIPYSVDCTYDSTMVTEAPTCPTGQIKDTADTCCAAAEIVGGVCSTCPADQVKDNNQKCCASADMVNNVCSAPVSETDINAAFGSHLNAIIFIASIAIALSAIM